MTKSIRIVEFSDWDLTSKTVSDIRDLLKSSSRYDIYFLCEKVILHIQDYPEQFPYIILMENNKWNAVRCLMWGENCGSGEDY